MAGQAFDDLPFEKIDPADLDLVELESRIQTVADRALDPEAWEISVSVSW
nr:hypothetical protein [uncultured bacterium]AXL05628.1 hypothetical protein [uncultured bacterium]